MSWQPCTHRETKDGRDGVRQTAISKILSGKFFPFPPFISGLLTEHLNYVNAPETWMWFGVEISLSFLQSLGLHPLMLKAKREREGTSCILKWWNDNDYENREEEEERLAHISFFQTLNNKLRMIMKMMTKTMMVPEGVHDMIVSTP